VDSVNEAVDAMPSAWEDYGNQLEKSINAATDAARQAVDTTTRGAEETADSAARGTKKIVSSKKSS
jgi:hypothetical protein